LVPLPPFIIFLLTLISIEQPQPGAGRDTATTQKHIHLGITCIKSPRPQFSIKLLALMIANLLFVPFPSLRFYKS